MILQNWWFTTLAGLQNKITAPLKNDIKCDVLIVGGGMTGISAASEFIGKGLSVVLVEKNILGGSSTGKSAGFLTPDSELELSQLVRRYGLEGAKEIWKVPVKGIENIVANVKKYNIECDLITQDSLFLGIGNSGWRDVQDEKGCRESVGFKQEIYNENELNKILTSTGYNGAVRYSETYGINALQYCQGMKKVLLQNNIQVFECSEVERIDGHTAYTHAGSVTAETIIIAMDKMEHNFNELADEVFHAQTFLSISEPLNDEELFKLFPSGNQFQMWDSTLVYSYFRLTGDNRLLLGGGTAFSTFMNHYYTKPHIIENVIKNFKTHFPYLKDLSFIQYWPGLIDSTRDLLPTIVKDKANPHIHFVMGVVGLPWASFCGSFVAKNVLGTADEDDKKYYEYFSDRRKFFLPTWMEKVVGKSMVFSVNNGWAKYYQVDKNDKPTEKKGEF